ncbi:MAG: tetratricopeptide repeat protein [Micromonosporaceae bacterium]|nr:tetratricopeptide repeat protein [Micromonosporaceae bacterium]
MAGRWMLAIASTCHSGRVRVFVSYATEDRQRAEWVAQQLRQAGYEVEIDIDWRYGDNFMDRMREALEACDAMVALFSPAYFAKKYTLMELNAWLAGRETGLVPLRIASGDVPTFYRPYIYTDLVGLPEEMARQVLVSAVAGQPGPVTVRPRRPADIGLGAARSLPRTWSVPARNLGFVGRDRLLTDLRERLTAGSRAVVQALHGWGGVGKTQLAIEYAHRFAREYDFVGWLDSQRPELIDDQAATIAVTAGIVSADTPTREAALRLKERLRAQSGWLLIFDNAEKPDDIRDWLPGGEGHVIITSRHRAWHGLAAAVEVDVFTRGESIEFLREQAGLDEADADSLAQALGDLPLAIAQAAGYLVSTGVTPLRYQTMLAEHAARVLQHGTPTGYPAPLAASITLSLQRLADTNPAALAMVRVCARLAPEPLPVDWFLNPDIEERPAPLRAIDASDLYAAAGTLGSLGLARPTPDGLVLHRLTQAVITDSLTDAERAETAAAATALVVATRPTETANPRCWPTWQTLLPHILALDPTASADARLRRTAVNAVRYQARRGDYRSAHTLAEQLSTAWATSLGPEHPDTLAAANRVGEMLRSLGDYAAAAEVHRRTLESRRRVLGEEHPDTLKSANNLAMALRGLGDLAAARDLHEQTLATRRRVLGDDHPDTRNSASNLAFTLRLLGEHTAARDIHEQVLATRRRLLGDDHPATLISANNLAVTLRELGDYAAAREIHEQVLATRRRLLGDDHPATLISAHSLAETLRDLGDYAAAREIHEQTLTARRRILGDDHPSTLISAHNLAETLHALGEHTAARDLLRQTLATRRRVLGDRHLVTLATARRLIQILRFLGDNAAADELEAEFPRAPEQTSPDHR